ncbi:MAG: hypothetical protein E6Q97_33985 [Desulfurellales bacterium]|nr:MAG: hypothetical protein E6Q97_33985 [Desulfurellales bacterium]
MTNTVSFRKVDDHTLEVHLDLKFQLTCADEAGKYPVDFMVDTLLDGISEQLTLREEDYQTLIAAIMRGLDAPLPQETNRG